MYANNANKTKFLNSSKELIFFVNGHKKVLRALVELDPRLLLGYLDFMVTDSALSSMLPLTILGNILEDFLDVAKSIPFDEKQTWFRDKIIWEQANGNIFVTYN
jgi:hypothetical protein